MINFEEELKKYKPVMEVKEVEQSIMDKDLTDMIDILKDMTGHGRINNSVNIEDMM